MGKDRLILALVKSVDEELCNIADIVVEYVEPGYHRITAREGKRVRLYRYDPYPLILVLKKAQLLIRDFGSDAPYARKILELIAKERSECLPHEKIVESEKEVGLESDKIAMILERLEALKYVEMDTKIIKQKIKSVMKLTEKGRRALRKEVAK
jgi:hypothetical protein